MTKDEIQKCLSSVPFVAFKVRLAGGEEVAVPTTDHAHLHPNERTLFVHLDQGGTEIIDVMQVTALRLNQTA